jgi:hypothetical protein
MSHRFEMGRLGASCMGFDHRPAHLDLTKSEVACCRGDPHPLRPARPCGGPSRRILRIVLIVAAVVVAIWLIGLIIGYTLFNTGGRSARSCDWAPPTTAATMSTNRSRPSRIVSTVPGTGTGDVITP